MKKLLILLILFNLFACQKESKKSDLIHLKLKEIEGYGPFEKRFGFLDWTPLTEKGIWGNTKFVIFSTLRCIYNIAFKKFGKIFEIYNFSYSSFN